MYKVITGRVVEGKRLGRKLGFPTANIELESGDSTPNGIYAVAVTLDNNIYYGVANVGIRPTIIDSDVKLLEIYIFDMSQDIYGKELSVELRSWFRDEVRFDDVNDLIAQIEEDVVRAKNYFKKL